MPAARYLTHHQATRRLARFLSPDVARSVLDSGQLPAARMPVANRPPAYDASAIRALCVELRAIQAGQDEAGPGRRSGMDVSLPVRDFE